MKIIFVAMLFLASCGLGTPENSKSEQAKVEKPVVQKTQPLASQIVKREVQMKGGSLNPLVKPKYKMWRINTIVTEKSPTISEASVSATLTEILRSAKAEAIQAGDIYAITVFLYQSPEHIAGGNGALGRAEWWPKGHSFDLKNASNIENLATHEEDIQVFSLLMPYAISNDSVVNRLPEKIRREIFTELVKSQDRASREAEARFPINVNNIPIQKLASYDFKGMSAKNFAETDKLEARYEKELLGQFKITDSELKSITDEAAAKNWPLPPSR